MCEGGPRAPAYLVEDVGPIQTQSNALVPGSERLWIVESGENTVSTYAPDERVLFDGFVDVGDDQNPYDVFVDEVRQRAYVTNYLGNSVSIVDTSDGRVLEKVEGERFDLPAGVAAAGKWIYVTNTAFRRTGVFGQGSVTVLDRETLEVVDSLTTQSPNPQFVSVVRDDEGVEWVAIVSSGVVEPREGDGTFVPTAPGGLELWRPGEDDPAVERQLYPMELAPPEQDARVGFPGRAVQAEDGAPLYMPSGTDQVLFVFDMEERAWAHGVASPLRFSASIEGSALHHASMGPGEILYITSFNDDRLHLWDTRCDAPLGPPIELGREAELIEGPHGVVPWGSGEERDVYFIMSLGNRIGRVRLNFGADI